MAKWEKSGLDILSGSSADHIKMVEAGTHAYLTDVTVSQLEISRNCELKTMDEKFYPMQYAMGVQNNSAYKHIFSEL